LNGEDGENNGKDKTWIDMTQVTSATVVSDSENTQDFNEYEYGIPTSYLTGASGEVQYTDDGVTYTDLNTLRLRSFFFLQHLHGCQVERFPCNCSSNLRYK
jgi:hypothetical protein